MSTQASTLTTAIEIKQGAVRAQNTQPVKKRRLRGTRPNTACLVVVEMPPTNGLVHTILGENDKEEKDEFALIFDFVDISLI